MSQQEGTADVMSFQWAGVLQYRSTVTIAIWELTAAHSGFVQTHAIIAQSASCMFQGETWCWSPAIRRAHPRVFTCYGLSSMEPIADRHENFQSAILCQVLIAVQGLEPFGHGRSTEVSRLAWCNSSYGWWHCEALIECSAFSSD